MLTAGSLPLPVPPGTSDAWATRAPLDAIEVEPWLLGKAVMAVWRRGRLSSVRVIWQMAWLVKFGATCTDVREQSAVGVVFFLEDSLEPCHAAGVLVQAKPQGGVLLLPEGPDLDQLDHGAGEPRRQQVMDCVVPKRRTNYSRISRTNWWCAAEPITLLTGLARSWMAARS